MIRVQFEHAPAGVNASNPQPGDLLFCRRKGQTSRAIRVVEAIRHPGGARWSHVACVGRPVWRRGDGKAGDGLRAMLVEALTCGVTRTPFEHYRPIEYVLARTSAQLDVDDTEQAMAFLYSCEGQSYAWVTDLVTGIGLTFGGVLFGGLDGTQMCSGLAAQMLVRGPFNFTRNPASLSPAQLAEELGVPATPRALRP